MPIRIKTPIGVVEFPDGWDKSEIERALAEQFPRTDAPPAPAPESPADGKGTPKFERYGAAMRQQRKEEAERLYGPIYKQLEEGIMGGGVMSAAPYVVGPLVKPGLKVIQGLARRLYGGLLKPKAAVTDSFDDVVGTLIEARAPISRGGLKKVTGQLGASRDAAMRMVQQAEHAGTQGVVAKDVLREFGDVIQELRKRADIGQANELRKVGARGKAILNTTARTGGDIPLTRAQALKETAQDAASGAYRVLERGAQKQLGADDLLDVAVARGLRAGIERKVPGIAAQNARTQALLGGQRALEDAVERAANSNMFGGGRDWAALLSGGLGTAAGGPGVGAVSAGTMRALATPSTGSRAAIVLNEASKHGLDDALQRALLTLLSRRE